MGVKREDTTCLLGSVIRTNETAYDKVLRAGRLGGASVPAEGIIADSIT